MNVYYDVEDNHYRTYPDGDIATVDQMRELIENKNVSIVKLQQENKILRENTEHNDKVVDKVNWENQLLKKEIHQLKEQLESSEKSRKEAIEYIKTKPLYEEEYDYGYDDELELLDINFEQAENDLLQILDIDKGE